MIAGSSDISEVSHDPAGGAASDARSVRARFDRMNSRESSCDLLSSVRIEKGELRDYQHLSRFHYRAEHPGVVTSVLRMVVQIPSVVGRYVQRDGERTTVGVLVRGLGALSCRLRDEATNRRYRGFGARAAGVMLNRELRTITRVVIDPRWRGLGLAVKLVRAALDAPEPGVIYTEALAAMGRVSPFFERAGMKRYDRARPVESARMLDVLEDLQIPACELACGQIISSRMARMDEKRRDWLVHELKRWHRRAFRTSKDELEAMDVASLLNDARDHLLFQPVYYLFKHETSK